MPYPRIHITNVRGHGIPPCPLCVFPPGDACSPHRWHRTHRILGCVFSHRTHLGGYGILPYPRRPLDNSPTDGTDAHRWFGCVGFSHGIHGTHRSFWQRRASHGFHRCPQIRRVWHPCHTHAALCQSSHGIHRIHRNFWRRRASHRFRRCSQMVRLRRVLWEDSLVAAWVWQGCHTLLICVHPCNLWENIRSQKIL